MSNQDNRQPEVLSETIPFIILATLSVIGRLFSGKLRRASYGVDDYMICIALMLTWGDFAIDIRQIYCGLGKHTAVSSTRNVVIFNQYTFAASIVYASCITAIKLSILLFYQRMFATPKFKLITKIIAGAAVAWWIAVVITQIFSCSPIKGWWDSSVPSKCVNPALYYIGAAVPNIITDIVMLCLPLRMVWRLHTSLGQKIALSITFMTGAFVVIASLYRIVLLHHANRIDPLWTYTDVVIWTSIEPSVGVLCACLPTLQPLLRETWFAIKYLRSMVSSITNQTQKDTVVRLESGGKGAQEPGFSHHAKWVDDGLNLHSSQGISRETAITWSARRPDPERDDLLLTEINVQHDLQIERAPRWTHAAV